MVLKNIQYAFLCLICNVFVSYENIQCLYCYMQEMKENYQFTIKILGKKFRGENKIFASGFHYCVFKLFSS